MKIPEIDLARYKFTERRIAAVLLHDVHHLFELRIVLRHLHQKRLRVTGPFEHCHHVFDLLQLGIGPGQLLEYRRITHTLFPPVS